MKSMRKNSAKGAPEIKKVGICFESEVLQELDSFALQKFGMRARENELLFRKWRKFSVENLHYFVHVAMRAHQL